VLNNTSLDTETEFRCTYALTNLVYHGDEILETFEGKTVWYYLSRFNGTYLRYYIIIIIMFYVRDCSGNRPCAS
jgi:hypothetical protein